MPFGLHSAPATFQRLVDRVLEPALEPHVFVYLDDIIVTSPTFEEHLKHLKEVFRRLRQARLRLNEDKCKFCIPKLRYLGHLVDKDGIRTDPEKISAITEWPTPRTVRQVRQFLGLSSWYRRFVPDFTKLATPLTRLTYKQTKWKWGEQEEDAFQALKTALVSTPVLACPDFTLRFVLQTDASVQGLGAVLTQHLDEGECVIAYASRSLNKAEKDYSATELECLAVVWGIRRMRGYLEGYTFTVVTEHQSLRWLQRLEAPTGRLARWLFELQEFDFEVRYRNGAANKVADALSRQPVVSSVSQIRCPWYQDLKRRGPRRRAMERMCSERAPKRGHPAPTRRAHGRAPRGHEDNQSSSAHILLAGDAARCRLIRPQLPKLSGTQTAPTSAGWATPPATSTQPMGASKHRPHGTATTIHHRALKPAGDPRSVIITDNGRQFVAQQFKDLLGTYKIRYMTSPAYVPHCNLVERANRTIKTMIRQYIGRRHTNWDQQLPALQFAFNTAVQESTAYTPAFLNTGKELAMPANATTQEGNDITICDDGHGGRISGNTFGNASTCSPTKQPTSPPNSRRAISGRSKYEPSTLPSSSIYATNEENGTAVHVQDFKPEPLNECQDKQDKTVNTIRATNYQMTRREDRQNQLLADLALSSDEDAPRNGRPNTVTDTQSADDRDTGTAFRPHQPGQASLAYSPSATNTQATGQEPLPPAREPGAPRTTCRPSRAGNCAAIRRRTIRRDVEERPPPAARPPPAETSNHAAAPSTEPTTRRFIGSQPPPPLKVEIIEGLYADIPHFAADVSRLYRVCTETGKWILRFTRDGQLRSRRFVPD
ncbi:uncharacterized protein LOC116851354 [Odontomachus brunneus]|uniref:uncharacterized protein LOC116851354 n=1 Tax=Odontomachus brunneus TaxID=486640 RepID=UPI0013F2417F|nr:uncharacterized protein LOC116851354 [Odontomachus brunneus]